MIYNAETGLNYNYYRDYDPELGRYIESDPIGLYGGMNSFGYVNGNAIRRLDLYGLFCLSNQQINAIAGGVGGAFSGFVAGAQTGDPYVAAAGLVLGGGFGAGFGYVGTSSGEAMAAGAGSSVMSGFTTPKGSLLGGLIGGGLSYQLQSGGGMSDNMAGIIGGVTGGAAGGLFSGFLSYNSLRSGVEGGLAGLSGAALSALVSESLRAANNCGCGK